MVGALVVAGAIVGLGGERPEAWLEGSELLGHDGEPVTCPGGELLRVDPDAEPQPPSPEEYRKASSDLPAGKSAAYNEYTAEFEVVDSVRVAGASVSAAGEPLIYECGEGGEPKLVPLSEVDPEAAEESRRRTRAMLREIEGGAGGGITGLGRRDSAAGVPLP